MNNQTPQEWVKRQLEKLGLHAEITGPNSLIVNDRLAVKVKVSNPQTRHYKSAKTGQTRAYMRWQADTTEENGLVVFIANADVYHPFVIPSEIIKGRSSIALSSHPRHYRGYLAEHLHNWANIGRALGEVA